MPGMDCIKKAAADSRELIINGRVKFTKMVKPVLKYLTRKRRTNSVTPSTCNYDVVVESAQNELNESELFQLHFKFYDGQKEADENARNEELEERLRESAVGKDLSRFGVERVVDGEVVVEPIASGGTYLAVPVHFVEGPSGEFAWAPLPDRDICRRGDDSPISENQIPEQQVPVYVTSAA